MRASQSSSLSLTPTYRPNIGQQRLHGILTGPQRHTLAVGGARSGKTFELVRSIVVRALRAERSRHAILRFRRNTVVASVARDTLPNVMRICFPGVPYSKHGQDERFSFPNDSEIWLDGLDEKERVDKILGTEFATMFFNECSQIPYASVLTALTRLAQKTGDLRQRAYYDLNPSGKTHWTNRLFIQHLDPAADGARMIADAENYAHVFLHPKDNADNLTPEFLDSLEALPEKARKRFWDGVYVDEVDGALWTYELLERCRLGENEKLPPFTQVVISVDPSGAAGQEDKRSDEIGIIAAAKGEDGRAYVLGDYTMRDAPEKWARQAIGAYHKHEANRIIAEQNFGGAMVSAVIRGQDANVPVKIVNASRKTGGKHVRADPVQLLYEKNMVRHVGRFAKLEDQLVNFTSAGYVGERSPDRADALVWAITELMLGNATPRAASGTFSWG